MHISSRIYYNNAQIYFSPRDRGSNLQKSYRDIAGRLFPSSVSSLRLC